LVPACRGPTRVYVNDLGESFRQPKIHNHATCDLGFEGRRKRLTNAPCFRALETVRRMIEKRKNMKNQEADGMTIMTDEGNGIVGKRVIYLTRKMSGPRLVAKWPS
jgi:hypothetical protein